MNGLITAIIVGSGLDVYSEVFAEIIVYAAEVVADGQIGRAHV